jgi:hypothetical protein
MPRLLKNLRITEVSAVKRSAGEGCEIKIMKQDESPSDRMRKMFTEALRPRYDSFFKSRPSFTEDIEVDPASSNEDAGAAERRNEDRYQDRKGRQQEGDIIATSVIPPRLQQMVDTIRTHAPQLSDGEIVHFLLHTSRGRSVAEHLSNISKKEPPMSRIDQLRAVAKNHGVRTIAKAINDEGDADGLTEHEFTELMMDEAKRKGLSFEKYFTDPANLDIRRAHQLTKSSLVEVQPVSVAVGFSDNNTDWKKAYDQLQAKAEELRASAPYLSVEQAFARVFEDQKNAELAARAHRRPQ